MAACAKIITLLLVSLLALAAIFVLRAEVYFATPKLINLCNQTHNPIGGDAIIQRFSKALQFKTITWDYQKYDTQELAKFQQFLKHSFPTVHSSPLVDLEVINNYSLLFNVKGSEPSLVPYLLCSHMDVVPVEMDKWDVDPFGGIIKDGYIYGRGAIDVKNTLMSILESLEYMLENGFKPRRSFYIAFGHDEEAQGVDGARHIADRLKDKGVERLEFLLDEGMVMFNNLFPGINQTVAVVAVSEKGYLTLKVKARGEVGHSSMAPDETAITTLAKAVSKLTATAHSNLFGLGPEREMFESFALYATYPYKLIYSNLWFFGPLLSRTLSKQPSSNGLVRTTSAVTIIKGGFKENVLPSQAEATVNHRVHPLQSIADVIEFNRQLINDERIEMEIKGSSIEPHPVSPYGSDSFGFQTIKQSLNQVFDNVIVAPGIMIASTDTRWYLNFTKSVYRFSPSVMMNPADTKRFHGHNERISIENYLKTVNFYHHIMLNSDESRLKVLTNVKDEL